MDKEFGSSQLGADQVGLQLADGRELMLDLLRDRAGRVDVARGTLVAREGRPRHLALDIAEVAQTLSERGNIRLVRGSSVQRQNPDPVHFPRLLRVSL